MDQRLLATPAATATGTGSTSQYPGGSGIRPPFPTIKATATEVYDHFFNRQRAEQTPFLMTSFSHVKLLFNY